MRFIAIDKAMDSTSLGTRLFGSGALGEGALLGLQRLNPHVDFTRIEPGTMLLVPEQAGLSDGQTASVGGKAFDEFAQQVLASVAAVVARVQSGHRGRLEQQTETPTLQDLLARMPHLTNEVGAALQVFDEDRKQAEVANKLLQTLEQELAAELDALRKLLG